MLILVFLIEWEQRDIPWAGIAAALAGTGSLLTGWAALKMANKEGRKEGGSEKAVEAERTAGD